MEITEAEGQGVVFKPLQSIWLHPLQNQRGRVNYGKGRERGTPKMTTLDYSTTNVYPS